MILEKVYDELMAQIEDLKKAVAAMGGGSSSVDYETQVTNLPKVNNITLKGNKKSSDLKIAYSMTEAEYAAATKNAESIYCLQENATAFEEEDETPSTYIHWTAAGSGYAASWVYAPSNQDFIGCTAVECDDATITIDQFQVVEGNVQVFLSCEDTTQIGETVTFTFTLTQAAGSTRIVKNGLQFGAKITQLYTGSTVVSSMELAESVAHFDLIEIVDEYIYSSTKYRSSIMVQPKLLIENVTFGSTSTNALVVKLSDATHLSRVAAGSDGAYVIAVYGIKF